MRTFPLGCDAGTIAPIGEEKHEEVADAVAEEEEVVDIFNMVEDETTGEAVLLLALVSVAGLVAQRLVTGMSSSDDVFTGINTLRRNPLTSIIVHLCMILLLLALKLLPDPPLPPFAPLQKLDKLINT
jgi:hypothetical protein